jgi:uncharacterized protein
MNLFRRNAGTLSSPFPAISARLLAGLLGIALALYPRETHAQLDQVLQRLLTLPPIQTPFYPRQPGYPPPGYQQYYPQPNRVAPSPQPGYPQQGYPQPNRVAPAYAAPQPPAAARATVDRGTVAHVQTMLNDLGYNVGTPDGSAGTRTVSALQAFQRDHGETPTGHITEATVAALQAVWYAQTHAAATRSPTAAGGQPVVERSTPSFDCHHASSPSERTICAVTVLSQLDQELSAAYATATQAAPPGGDQSLINSQRAWFRQRNACGADAQCLQEIMSGRLAELRRWPGTTTSTEPQPLPPEDERTASSAGGPAAQDLPADPGSMAAAHRWNLPTAQGLPVIDISFSGKIAVGSDPFRPEESAQPGPLSTKGAWSRAIRALGLAATPQATSQLDDLSLARLACIFLDKNERVAVFGRDERFGPSKDVCDVVSPAYWRLKGRGGYTVEWPPSTRLALQSGLAAFRTRELPRLVQTAPQLPFHLLLRWQVGSRPRFDAARGGYQLQREAGDPSQLGPFLERPLDSTIPDFWPIAEADAAAFEARRISRRGEPLFMAMPLTIIGIDAGPGGPQLKREATGLPDGASWKVVEGEISLYNDKNLTDRLYTFHSADQDATTVVAQPAPAGSAAPTASSTDDAAAVMTGGMAAQAWGLPMHDGLPVLELTGFSPPNLVGTYNPPDDGRMAPNYTFPPARGPWTRAVRALGLAAFPDNFAHADDQDVRHAACIFLTAEEIARVYGRNPAFGEQNDICVRLADEDGANLRVLFRKGAAAFRAQALPDITARAPKLPMRLIADLSVDLDKFDPAVGGYRLEKMTGSGSFTIFGTVLNFKPPAIWPITEKEAAAFETRRGPQRPRRIHLAFPITITGVSPAPAGAAFDPATGLPAGARLILDEGEVTLYDDPGLSKPLYKFVKLAAVAAAPPGGAVASGDRLADANAAAAAARWKLPTRFGLPLVDLSGSSSSAGTLDGLFNYVNDSRPGHVEWTRAMAALGLSLSPDIAAQMSPSAILSLACLYLPPSRLVMVGAQPYCGGIKAPPPGDEFKVRDAAATFRAADLPAILSDAPRLPLRLLVVMPLNHDAWNETRVGFPLRAQSYSAPSLFGTRLRFKIPDFWPATMPLARAFVEAHRTQQTVYLAMPITITGFAPPERTSQRPGQNIPPGGISTATALPAGAEWQFDYGEMTLYADAALRQKLYVFGRPPSAPKPAYGTPAAQAPHPVGPVPFNEETLILAALHQSEPPAVVIDWAKAAESRLTLDRRLVQDPEWAKRDPWGVLFRRASDNDANPNAAEITAFRDWTERRAKAMPGSFVFQDIPAYPVAGVGPRRLTVFNPYEDKAWSASSAVPFRSSAVANNGKLPAEVTRRGVMAGQVMPLDMRFAGIDTPVLAVLPRNRDDYVLDLPKGVPPLRSDVIGTRSNGSTLDIEVAIDAVEPVEFDEGQRTKKLILLRVQPLGATLRMAADGSVVAATSFPRTPWPASSSPPPELWPPPVSGPAAQVLAAPYGPALYGVQLGMTLADAEKAIRGQMKVGRVLDMADPVRDRPEDQQKFARTMDSRLFISDDMQESIAVFISRVAPVGRVVEIWHRTSADGDHWDKALAALTAKYGPPVDGAGGSAAFWGDRSMVTGRGRSQCSGKAILQRPWEGWTEDGRPRPSHGEWNRPARRADSAAAARCRYAGAGLGRAGKSRELLPCAPSPHSQ